MYIYCKIGHFLGCNGHDNLLGGMDNNWASPESRDDDQSTGRIKRSCGVEQQRGRISFIQTDLLECCH